MDKRIELQHLLEEIIGSKNVYYQPPENIKMNYPAIIYSRNDISEIHADNEKYKQDYTYQVIVIDKNPDSEIVSKLAKLRYCNFNRHYVFDNLNHDVFTIYY